MRICLLLCSIVSAKKIHYWGKILGKTNFIDLVSCSSWSMALMMNIKSCKKWSAKSTCHVNSYAFSVFLILPVFGYDSARFSVRKALFIENMLRGTWLWSGPELRIMQPEPHLLMNAHVWVCHKSVWKHDYVPFAIVYAPCIATALARTLASREV